MKKIIRYLVIFIAVFCSSELQAQILSVGVGNGFNIGAGTIVSLDSIELNPSATYSFSNNTLSKSNTVSNSTTITYINKVYQFSATSDPYSGVLKLYYNNNQLNGLTASDLKLLLFNGTSWSLDSNLNWQPPVAYPTDGKLYGWFEPNQQWIEIVSLQN